MSMMYFIELRRVISSDTRNFGEINFKSSEHNMKSILSIKDSVYVTLYVTVYNRLP